MTWNERLLTAQHCFAAAAVIDRCSSREVRSINSDLQRHIRIHVCIPARWTMATFSADANRQLHSTAEKNSIIRHEKLLT